MSIIIANRKERISLLQIIDTSNSDEISAFLTTTLVSRSYDVESTQHIVTLWDNLRKNIKLQDKKDFISAILATGRIMDFSMEIDDPNIINAMVSDINRNIARRTDKHDDYQKELLSAFIAAASISRTEEVEKIRQIVNLWSLITENLSLKDDLDCIVAILTIGRIMELKTKVESYEVISDIFLSLRSELENRATNLSIGQKELAGAFITSAYMEITPKVERIGDIIGTWLKICNQISVKDQWDYITMILSTGKIKDLDAQNISIHESLKDINDKIKSQIKEIVH